MLNDIYFLNSQKLVKELKEGTFSEVRALKHLIVTAILGRFSFEFPIHIDFSESEINLWGSLTSVLFFFVAGFITYYGLWLTYQANSKGDGKDFFLRLTALVLPIGFKLVIYFMLICLVSAGIIMLVGNNLNPVGAVISLVVFLVLMVVFLTVFYIQLRNHMAILSGYENV